jgi:hypothetical protein
MKESDARFNLTQAFAWKAAWFSLLAPLSSVLIALALSYFSNDSGPNPTLTPAFIGKLVFGGALLVQITSLIMAVAGGLIAESYLAKGIAVIGLFLSLGTGFVALLLLLLETWGGSLEGPC